MVTKNIIGRMWILVLWICCLALMTLPGCTGPLHEQVDLTSRGTSGVRTLAIIVPREPGCTVFYERARATAAGGALLGFIGDAVYSANIKSKDDGMTDLVAHHFREFSARLHFVESISRTLNKSDRFKKVEYFDGREGSGAWKNHDAVVMFHIMNWGIRLADREKDMLAAFIELKAEMASGNNEKMWDEIETILGQGRHSFEAYQNDGPLLVGEVRDIIEDAGIRMANLLIYK